MSSSAAQGMPSVVSVRLVYLITPHVSKVEFHAAGSV